MVVNVKTTSEAIKSASGGMTSLPADSAEHLVFEHLPPQKEGDGVDGRCAKSLPPFPPSAEVWLLQHALLQNMVGSNCGAYLLIHQ